MFNPQAKLLHHGIRVERWLKTGHTDPVLFEVAPTGYCNAACPWCLFKGKKDKNRIDRKVMIHAIDDMANLGVKALNWSGGGEPTLHPEFEYFVDRAQRQGLQQGLFTNGYEEIPMQKAFSWIRITVTDKGIGRIKAPKVPFGICVNQIPEQSEEDLVALCAEAQMIGARYFQIRPALVGSHKKQPLIRPPKYLEECRSKGFDVYVTDYKYREAIRPKEYKACYGYHFCPSIDWKGHLSVCLYLTHKKEYILGDLNKTPLLDLWPDIKKKVKVIKECQNCCKNHEINKILYASRNIGSVDFL